MPLRCRYIVCRRRDSPLEQQRLPSEEDRIFSLRTLRLGTLQALPAILVIVYVQAPSVTHDVFLLFDCRRADTRPLRVRCASVTRRYRSLGRHSNACLLLHCGV